VILPLKLHFYINLRISMTGELDASLFTTPDYCCRQFVYYT